MLSMSKKRPPLTPEALEFFRIHGAKGGKLSASARMKKLTHEERVAIAKKAVAAREAKRKAARKN
jgi:hypothetical protein